MVEIKLEYIDEICNLSCEIKTLNYLLNVLITYEQDNIEQKSVKGGIIYLIDRQTEVLDKLSKITHKEDLVCKK